MKIAVLSANLGGFDQSVDHMMQEVPDGVEVHFHQFTDADFPPITGLTPRLQYRIPKLFGWQMFPGYDYYIWLDGSMTFQHPHSIKWFLEQIGSGDMAVFRHPWRRNIREEVMHVDEKLKAGNKYIVSRYQNGLHMEHYMEILKDKQYVDDKLYASTSFMYRNTKDVQEMMKEWWHQQSRYFTVDQIAMTYAVRTSGLLVAEITDNIFKSIYISLTSKHK